VGERLEGKVCVVTGAAQGIGAAYARALAREGADVAIIDLKRIDQAGPVVDDIEALGRRALTIEADVSDAEQMAAMGKQVVDELGRVDVLVNNAFLAGAAPRGGLAEYPLDDWREVVAVGLTGTLALTQGILPAMAEGSVIVNVTSGAAGKADWGAYAVAKLALDGMTRMLREELAPRGITCVAINPGGLRTAMRAAAFPDEDPATLPHPSSVLPAFVAVAAGEDPGWRVEAYEWG
jgi:NAD(P)-dependent dehydrogenase (short-subunit alcohol dehydrogenase family)